ncbi:Sorting nexin mvp1 [Elasticomyces elasticus]|uniref:Sorting nexin MVP1 n=1 Tax=Elasticomyces elasticus TaxID=574655 RepID=A0AAN8A3Q9_9PEZI|nr:Sorting nexin mvp1 [Elasticomyces elasticus]
MSLFGAEDPPARPKSANLFGSDDTPAQSKSATSSSMFGEEPDANDASPWGFTPTKKTMGGKGSLVKNLLAGADVPEVYVDTFDALQSNGSVSEGVCRSLLRDTVPRAESKIWTIVSSNGQTQDLGRNEFNVLLALIGLAQEGEDISLDSVDERRGSLPVPSLPEREQQQAPATPQQQPSVRPGAQQGTPTPQQQNGNRKQSFGAGFGEADPWGSPEMHKGHGHLNGAAAAAAPQRTTSTFTTANVVEGGGDAAVTAPDTGTSWSGGAGFSAESHGEGFGGPVAEAGGFGDGAGTVRRPAAPRVQTSKGAEEVVTVNLLDEKEGLFMFQHRNYEIASVRRATKVIRRYSDFVWLLDCLHKRYPFRQLPLLPPKRVAINGNHLAADQTFVEKRRRGLARFANAVVRHPVLREEQLVVMFLSVPTELSVWRKQATISVQEEFVGKSLPPNLEDSLPQNLQDTFDTVRSGVRRSAELYINLCNLTERLCKRKEGLAAEYGRFSLNLTSLTETSADTYAIDANDVPLLNEGLKSTAKHVGTSQALLEDESRAWDEGLLEDLKGMRDSLVSMREMFERRERGARDTIPALERRIEGNERKLQGVKAKGDAAKPGEAEKVESAIVADKQSIVAQHARGVFIKECVRDEIAYFNGTMYRVSRLHQDWAQERVKYAELGADNWRGMVDAVEGMPLGD